MRLNLKREMFAISMLVIGAIVGIYYYPILPDIVPSHFNLQGKADGWMAKPDFFITMGVVFLSVYLLLTFLPFIDPLKSKVVEKFRVVLLLRDVLLAFFLAIFIFSLQAARQGAMHFQFIGIAVGLLIFLLGNYMPKIPQNWFLGIRTPWTISSETVWKKTHILGGWLFSISGLLFMASGFFKIDRLIPLVGVLSAALISVAYSFYLYKTLGGGNDAGKSAA